ncbi:MAG TPA: metallophosphoesterase [Candidatus Acidoferrales bacterium]|nr:metallophosphoesterase [Candidatus Acidoferrales bacterium]
MRSRISVFISIVQAILLLAHLFLYETWIFFHGTPDPPYGFALKIVLSILSVSFVAASLLAQKYFNPLVRAIYTMAAVWLGLVNFFFLAACAIWIIYGLPLLLGFHLEKRDLATQCFGAGLLAGILALANAAWPRVVRISIKLPNLPASWRGRTAALVSDLHLGHVRNGGFVRRIVRKLSSLKPDVLFIPGDMFDGTAVNFGRLSKTWKEFSAPLGSYFIAGNHEQFASYEKYFGAVTASGIRVVHNEKIILDGLQVVGVHYLDSKNMERFRSILAKAELDPNIASVLLVHDPSLLSIAMEAGISLQLSGHTHRGQFFPFTKIVSRIYGIYAYGLHHFDALQVYTSCGVGTWGPPMRLGSNPEIVLIHFE